MPKLFGIDIAGIVNQSMGTGLLPCTLIKVVDQVRDPNNMTAGTTPIYNNYSARGFIEDYKDYQVNGTTVRTGDRMVSILGASISGSKIPEADDKVTIEGDTYNIVRVMRDPAGAMYSCQARGNGG
jgi:hypothetical protein